MKISIGLGEQSLTNFIYILASYHYYDKKGQNYRQLSADNSVER